MYIPHQNARCILFAEITVTLNGFAALFELIHNCYDEGKLEKMPKQLPILLVSGADDPVGNYGESVEKVYHSQGKYETAQRIRDIAVHILLIS